MKNTKQQQGFTIIELLIATTVFSIALIVILASFLQVGRMFYKGVSVTNVNEAARTLVDNISSDVRLTNNIQRGNLPVNPSTPLTAGQKYYFCTGVHRYTFIVGANAKVKNTAANNDAKTSTAGVVQDVTNGSCPDPNNAALPDGARAKQILGPDMQVNRLDFLQAENGANLHVHLIFYGVDNSIFNSAAHPADTTADHNAALSDVDAYCSGDLYSTQFCATADISTNITSR